uniref:Phospholipase A-2-activating protein n=1 Tax=Guillardia theta TaxID=55529 RepID=A0A7S4KYY7_GUITH
MHPQGAVVSGGYDRTMSGQTIVKPVINIWEGDSIVGTLEGHTLTVCGLTISPTGHLVSVSWDKTARVWDLESRSCVSVLSGHEQAVWAAICFEDGSILTGSADKTIKRWKGNVCEHTYTGHSDCVRALAHFPGVGFASAGNDCSIRLWALSGDCLMVLNGHQSFVYSLSVFPSGDIVSSSEDKTCKVWRDGNCVATLPHTGSVWAVCTLPDGDIVTACADGIARVFSRDTSRFADADVLAAYDASLASQAIAAQEVGGVKMSELPGLEALEAPGTKDGATKIIRVDEKAYAYSWNSGESKWDQIGVVVDGPAGGGGDGGQVMMDGRTYDRIFDIEIDEGVTLKLGYNYGQNPYAVAQEFIWNNDLPQDHLEQIAQFIDKNANQGVTLGAESRPTRGADPLTGAHDAMYESQKPAKETFVTFASEEHIPRKAMIFFELPGKQEAIEKKAMEFNDALANSMDENLSQLAMNSEEKIYFANLVKVAFGKDAISKPSNNEYALLRNKLLKWPVGNLFPVLDVLRLLVLNPFVVNYLVKNAEDFDVVKAVASVTSGPAASVPAATRIMSTRFFVNCFRSTDMRGLISKRLDVVLPATNGSVSYGNAQVNLAYATLLLNVAVQAYETKAAEVGGMEQVKRAISGGAEFLHAAGKTESEDSVYRALAAVGTLASIDDKSRALVKEFQVQAVANEIKASHPSDKVKACASQLLSVV